MLNHCYSSSSSFIGIPAAPILNGYCGDWELSSLSSSQDIVQQQEQEIIDFGARTKLNFF